MATHYVVSAHGYVPKGKTSSGAQGIQLTPVPPGVTMHFFVSENTPLPANIGWSAYYALMTSPLDLNAVTRVQGHQVFTQVTASLPNYRLYGDNWIDNNHLSASGIFIAGDTFHQDSRTQYLKPTSFLTLEGFFRVRKPQPGDHVYWIACRSWS